MENFLSNVTSYSCLIGRMLYLAVTRPDIAYCAQVLIQFLEQPKLPHYFAVLILGTHPWKFFNFVKV